MKHLILSFAALTVVSLYADAPQKAKIAKKTNQPTQVQQKTKEKEKKQATKKIDPKKSKFEPIIITPDKVDVITKSKVPVLLDVYAEWCGPCKKMAPTFNKVAQNLNGKVLFAKLKMDSFAPSDPAITWLRKNFDVTIDCVPTMIYFNKGKVVEVIRGGRSAEDLTKTVQGYKKTK